MAKSNFLAMMKAKPNARGKRSHLPLHCSVKDCEEDFIISYPLTNNNAAPKRICLEHATIFNKAPQDSPRAQLDAILLQLSSAA